MMLTPTLEIPEAWNHRRTGALVGTVFLALLMVVFVLTGILRAVREQDAAQGLLFYLFAILLLPVLPLVGRSIRIRRSTTAIRHAHVPELGGAGVLLPYSTLVHALSATLMGCSAALFTLFLLGSLLGTRLTGFGIGSFVQIAVLAGVLGYALWFLFDLARGRIARGHLALGPDGIHHRSKAMCGCHPWDEIVDITALPGRNPAILVTMREPGSARTYRTSSAWRQSELTLSPHLLVRTEWLAVDPVLTYHALRFYHDNPGRRGELGSEAGVQRLREGRVDHGDRVHTGAVGPHAE